jgi:uncharacterized phage protein (TIGR01671 family)
MQREIKFKAWDGRTMFEPFTLIEGLNSKNKPFAGPYEEKTIFLEYTGQTDKNGKEIYEGDILNIHLFTQELGSSLGVKEGECEFKAEICFQEMGLWVQGDKEEHCGYILWFHGLHEESFEVIGNIYENPELIKE